MLVSGMVIGSMFTLFVVPSIYTLVARNRVPALVQSDERTASVPQLAEAAV